MHKLSKAKDLGIRIINGDQSSNVSTLLGIKGVRRAVLEEVVDIEVELRMTPSALEIMRSILHKCETPNELAYCMYYFGTKGFKPTLRSLDMILPDD